MNHLIRIENVNFRYAACELGALHNINLHVSKGELVVLLGGSGCGKTTITRLINRLVPEFFEGELTGTVLVNGRDISAQSIQSLAGTVGSVFQDPRSQFFATDTTAEIAFSCENIGIPQKELITRIEKAAGDLKISRLLDRSIFELSSGEKQAVAIASVYALSPKILVLDEPSANLDARASIHLMEVLQHLKKQGYTIVISEHRIHYLKDIADRAILIEDGRISRELSTEAFKNLTNEAANSLGLRSMDLQATAPPGVSARFIGNGLRLENISFGYDRKNLVLKDISLDIPKGAVVGIVGNNGVGKSTLLDIICGLKKEHTGEVFINESPASAKARIQKSYLVMQDSDYQLFTESVEKELYLGIRFDSSFRRKGAGLLEHVGLAEVTSRHPASLSGGQKQRLCIAVACMKDAEIICLDEPTSGLDYRNMKRVSVLLQKLSAQGKTVLLTSHDFEFLLSACTHICHLKNGTVNQFFKIDTENSRQIYKILYPEEEKS